MGQHWELVNIDRRERLSLGGKLDEIFYDDFRDIMALLAGSWAGCRIMCIGDYMRECPPNVLTSEEVSEIASYHSDDSDDDSPTTLYDFTYQYYRQITSRGYIDLGGMVLRNPTKHVYVRRDVAVEELKSSEKSGDLGNILFTNICWSANSSCNMMLDLSQGGWAGDRFDVVPLSSVEDDEEEWEDVTEDQVKLTRFALSC
ncbi:hypothetical protein ARMSODRAFT_958548 [Armillaria solidipes]|uniref:Uncharacterized protein n=1 Tax=Armillaria solidipes TaxID=1076256 RepID=A0A2H3BTW7_9AGAR|nr:hypothetical protein ARMSODRAFT_958548 [Armillaria solidipes]